MAFFTSAPTAQSEVEEDTVCGVHGRTDIKDVVTVLATVEGTNANDAEKHVQETAANKALVLDREYRIFI